MDRVDHIKQVRDKLNDVGCGRAMKWLHETPNHIRVIIQLLSSQDPHIIP